MDDSMGRLVYLPAGVSGPDPEAFLEDVLTGWRRAQLAQGTSSGTIHRRYAIVLRMADFVGTFPWQWTPADADDFFGHMRGVLVALCDIFGIEAGDLITYTATDTRQTRTKAVNAPSDVPLLNAYRPVKARIVSDD